MKDRNVHALAQFLLNNKALGCLDVFQVDTPKCGLKCGDNIDQFIRVGFIHFDIKDIDISELLEQNGLAFHHRLGSQRAYRAQTKNSRPVTDNRDKVATGCDTGCRVGVFCNQFTGVGNAW